MGFFLNVAWPLYLLLVVLFVGWTARHDASGDGTIGASFLAALGGAVLLVVTVIYDIVHIFS